MGSEKKRIGCVGKGDMRGVEGWVSWWGGVRNIDIFY
jgi:hypothetical protein